jgi:hypothetical protein
VSRAYGRLALLLLVAAVALGILSRRPRREAAPAPAPAPDRVNVVLALRPDGGVEPETSAVPKNAEVTLVAANEGTVRRVVALAGYEDRVRLEIDPGASRRVVFLADRPGDDLAWLIDGSPRGRFAVTGSHLVEGHR